MGSKGIVIFGIILAMVLLISSEVAARELAETSNTINTSPKYPDNEPDKNPERPFCNGKVYGSCIPKPPLPKSRRCSKKIKCGRPPATADATTKTDAEVEAEAHN